MSAPEIKPWMRRTVDEGYRYVDGTSEKERYLKAIAAHAPPVDILVAALKLYRESGFADAAGALSVYDPWLAREGK